MTVTDASSSVLMKAASPELYRRNAFRVTGLMVTATAREVARQADKLKMLAELGGQASLQLPGLPEGPPPTLEDVREAAQKLKEPELRMVDEFFWFWPEDWSRPAEDAAFAALKAGDVNAAFDQWTGREEDGVSVTAMHNLAVLFHMRAMEWTGRDLQDPLPPPEREQAWLYWMESGNRWEQLVADNRLWEALRDRIRLVDEAALTTSLAFRLRADLPRALDQIQAGFALAFATEGREDEARRHAEALRARRLDGSGADEALDAALLPVRRRIQRHVETARAEARENREQGILHTRTLLDAVTPLFQVITMIHGRTSGRADHTGDEIAEAALACAAAAYNGILEQEDTAGPADAAHRADTAREFLGILNEILGFTRDVALMRNLKTNIATVQKNLAFDVHVRPLLDGMLRIKDSPKSPVHRLKRIRKEVLPGLEETMKAKALPPEQLHELGDTVASILMALGAEAFTRSQRNAAVATFTTALKYAHDPELRGILTRNRKALRGSGNLLPPMGLLRMPRPFRQLPWYEKLWRIPRFFLSPPFLLTGSGQARWLAALVCGLLWMKFVLPVMREQDARREAGTPGTYYAPLPDPQDLNLKVAREALAKLRERELTPKSLPPTGTLVYPPPANSPGTMTLTAAPGDGGYLVKLVDPATRFTIALYFVRAGEKLENMPLSEGTYEMRFAAGDSWFGFIYLFGPLGNYRKSDTRLTISPGTPLTVILEPTRSPGLSTRRIDVKNF